MRRRPRWVLTACACVVVAAPLYPQTPLDGERVVRRVDSLWAAAVSRGTRAEDGAPGSRYWSQRARYDLRATLDLNAGSLRAEGLLRYYNRSPDTLRVIALSLAQNLFRAGAPHNERVPLTGGIVLDALCVERLAGAADARPCASEPGPDASLRVDHTIAWLTLPASLLPGDSLDLRAVWRFVIPTADAPRMGSDGSVSLLAYWYPQFCVYDDVTGWQADPYLATGEFYMDHADYDVRITVPRGVLVAATGVLKNADEVLSPAVRERLERAARSFAIVPIVTDSLRRASAATASGASLTWRFSATDVRDFAFYASRDVVWDAMTALVRRSPTVSDTVLVHAFYRPREKDWRRAADFGRQSIEHFSRLLWPYPWPQMTLVEGVVSGGMEYPMMTAVSVSGDSRELLSTVAHEVGHMWYPMQVSSDERRFAWMDEGIASWLERSLLQVSTGRTDDDEGIPDLYRAVVGMRSEQSMLTHADHYSGPLTYTAASYDKLVVVFRAFSAEYGDSALVRGLRAYGAAWNRRHPYPPDLIRMVFAGAGADRDVFVKEWVHGVGSFDVRIDDVARWRDTLTITIRSDGGAHLSVPVAVSRDGGQVEQLLISAADFRRNPVQTLRVGDARSVRSVILDPKRTRPDINFANQRWAP